MSLKTSAQNSRGPPGKRLGSRRATLSTLCPLMQLLNRDFRVAPKLWTSSKGFGTLNARGGEY